MLPYKKCRLAGGVAVAAANQNKKHHSKIDLGRADTVSATISIGIENNYCVHRRASV
jgi:hypothetical protein